MGPERDITFARALDFVRARALRPPSEPVPVGEAAGRLLTEDVHVLADHPAFTNSAMDGWAVRAADAPGGLEVVGESAAGEPWRGVLHAGQSVRVSTGARMPEGADAVVPVEVADAADGVLTLRESVVSGAYVRHRGEDSRTGDRLLVAGTRLAAHQLAAAAGAGHPFLSCARRPRVAVLVSGTEVAPVGAALAAGQVWDVNGTVLPALARAAGGVVVRCVYVPDDHDATVRALRSALDDADVVVSTGGVSMGTHDHLRPALAEVGVREVFWGVGIRPGHPLWLGESGGVRVLALPGNPVSAVVCFAVFGRPLLGCDDPWTPMPMAVDHPAQTPRTDLIRCHDGPDGLVPAPRQASHDITSLASATHIAVIPAGGEGVRAGGLVQALRLTG